MGQYWYVVNLDKREFVHPHKLGCGLKLGEQLGSYPGTGAALIVLCAAMPEARGGGDLDRDGSPVPKIIGRWAGDRIALVGDYAKDSDLSPIDQASTIYDHCANGTGGWIDVSEMVAADLEYELGGQFEGEGWRTWNDGAGE